MKKVILLVVFLITSMLMYAQEFAVPIGIHYNEGNESTKNTSSWNITMDVMNSNSYIFGFEGGFGGSLNGEDFTGTINLGRFKNVNIIGTLGFTQLEEYQDRFDSFYILGDNGYYVVLENLRSAGYLKICLSYRYKKVIPEISMGTMGLQFGCSFILY